MVSMLVISGEVKAVLFQVPMPLMRVPLLPETSVVEVVVKCGLAAACQMEKKFVRSLQSLAVELFCLLQPSSSASGLAGAAWPVRQ